MVKEVVTMFMHIISETEKDSVTSMMAQAWRKTLRMVEKFGDESAK